MTLQKLIKVLIVGAGDAYPLAEDALTALKCVDVTDIERGEHSFLVEGWLPQIWFEDLRDILELGSDGAVTALWDDSVEPAIIAPPVLLENPRFVRPFEHVVQMFSLPGREGYDPTLLTFLTLPLFFGFVIGDIGYGLAFLAIGTYVRRRFQTPLGELAGVFLLLGGGWSIAFGVVMFAEVFAFHVDVGPLRIVPLDKLLDVPELLLLSLGIGLAHLNLGLAVGFVYERRRVGLRAAAIRKLSWYVVEAGFVLLGVGAIGFLAGPIWLPAFALLAIGIAFVSLGGGFVDVIEVPSFASNILSYLRLGILGVAKAALGLALNVIVVEGFLPYGIVGWVLGGAVFVVGHGVTMGLAIVTVGVHVLRLHYVEFYSKVYPREELGTTRPFVPTATFRTGRA